MQIIDEGMVEDLACLLGSGEVPNLFDTGEILSICESVRSRAKAAKMDGSRGELYAFFVQEVRHTLCGTSNTIPHEFVCVRV